MKFEEEKLILTEEEFKLVKQASILVNPLYAGTFLHNSIKNKRLRKLEEKSDDPSISFYMECIKAYRSKNYEIR